MCSALNCHGSFLHCFWIFKIIGCSYINKHSLLTVSRGVGSLSILLIKFLMHGAKKTYKCTGWSLRCVHTMPRSRMQHMAALLRGKSCSAYATNSIASTLKNNFLQTQKLRNKTSELRLIFFCNWLMPFWNPLLIIYRVANLWWDRHFADRIFMLHGMLRHAEALPKPRHIDVHIIHAICRMARPHIVSFCHAA